MAFELRPYQEKLSKDAQKLAQKVDKNKGIFIQSQAGSGKTVIMADIAKAFTDRGEKVLFLVHRDSIIQQVNQTFDAYGVNMKLFKASTIRTYHNDIFVRNQDFEPNLILVDEAHHAVNNTYLKVMQYYQKQSMIHGRIVQLYFTATPYRLDKKDFLSLADKTSILYGPTTKELIKQHYLAPFDYFEPKVMDLSSLKSYSKGDFTKESVAKAGKSIKGSDLVNIYQSYCSDEQALIYAASIDSSKEYAKAFNDAGIPAEHLDGVSSKKKRRKIIQKYREGKIKVLSNVELFTEGLDLPGASVAFLVRPTKSLSLYIQFSMRVLRYQEGKKAKIFDFAELHDRFGLPDTDFHWNLESRNPIDSHKKQKNNARTHKCSFCKCIFDVLPGEKKKWYVKCPNCGQKVWLKSPDTQSPLKELSDDEIEDKFNTAIELSKVSPDEIGKFQSLSPELPLNLNYQIAQRELGYQIDNSYDIISEMLSCILSELYPTEKEINDTLELTDVSVNRKILLEFLTEHNHLIESVNQSLDEVNTSKPLKDNFDIIKNSLQSSDTATAVLQLFTIFRERPEFREYFAEELLDQSVYRIEDALGIGHNQEISKLILKQRNLVTKVLSNRKPPIGLVFLGKVTNVQQEKKHQKKHRYSVTFQDLYHQEYSKKVSNLDIYHLLNSQQKKQALTDSKGYLLLNHAYVLVRPMQTKKGVTYSLERAKNSFN